MLGRMAVELAEKAYDTVQREMVIAKVRCWEC